METRATGADRLPLAGKRVLITRAREQADSLARLLAEAGAEPLLAPAIQFEPPTSWEEADRAIGALTSYDWIVFTSANGVRFLLQRLEMLGRERTSLAAARLAAIGPATAAALDDAGLHVELVPPEFIAESVAAELITIGVSGRRILVARAAEARETLALLLREAGAEVDEVPVYRTVGSTEASGQIREQLISDLVDAVTFTSSSTVRHFLGAVDGTPDLLTPLVVACIGPITAATAQGLGVRVDVVAEEYTVQGLVRALVHHYQPTSVHSTLPTEPTSNRLRYTR